MAWCSVKAQGQLYLYLYHALSLIAAQWCGVWQAAYTGSTAAQDFDVYPRFSVLFPDVRELGMG
jgi:hypothetical protein